MALSTQVTATFGSQEVKLHKREFYVKKGELWVRIRQTSGQSPQLDALNIIDRLATEYDKVSSDYQCFVADGGLEKLRPENIEKQERAEAMAETDRFIADVAKHIEIMGIAQPNVPITKIPPRQYQNIPIASRTNNEPLVHGQVAISKFDPQMAQINSRTAQRVDPPKRILVGGNPLSK